MGFLFPIEMVIDVCPFTWATQSLQLAKGEGVFRHSSVCKGQLQSRSVWPGAVWHPWLLCPGVQTSHFILALAEGLCKQQHPDLKGRAADLAQAFGKLITDKLLPQSYPTRTAEVKPEFLSFDVI